MSHPTVPPPPGEGPGSHRCLVDAQPGPQTWVQTRACDLRPSWASADTGPQAARGEDVAATSPGPAPGLFPLMAGGGWHGPPWGWRGGLGGPVQGPVVTILCLLPPPPLRGQDPLPEFRASMGGQGNGNTDPNNFGDFTTN